MQSIPVETVVRSRIRGLRAARGWSLNELAERCHMSASTISRIETGTQRVTFDQVAVIAAALGTTLGRLVESLAEEQVIIAPQVDTERGLTTWILDQAPSQGGMVVARFRITRPAPRNPQALRAHPGRDWFVVLSGAVELLLGDATHTVDTGQAAAFSTMTPHAIGASDGPAEILAILDSNGQRHHINDSPDHIDGTQP